MSQATAETLFRRLRQIGAIDIQGVGDSDDARDAIEHYQCAWAVCARINGRVASFANYYAQVYGRTLDGKRLKGAA